MSRSRVFEQTLLGFLGPVKALLQDAEVSEILINGHQEVFVEKFGVLHRTELCFADEDSLYAAIRNLAQYVGRPIDPTRPVLEGRLPDGSRVEAVIPPAAPRGPHLAIRRFRRDALQPQHLVASGSITQSGVDTLSKMVRDKRNILVSGGTGSGKTSLLNVLSSFIPDAERTVVIEDARELQLQHAHVVQLEAQPADSKGRGEVSVHDLFRASLRLRPDRIVIGEIRGGEALEMIQAMLSGHRGCMSTVHATSPSDAMHRLETMALMSQVELPLAALRSQLSAAIDVIVQVTRHADGSRRVDSIAEVGAYAADDGYQLIERYVVATVSA